MEHTCFFSCRNLLSLTLHTMLATYSAKRSSRSTPRWSVFSIIFVLTGFPWSFAKLEHNWRLAQFTVPSPSPLITFGCSSGQFFPRQSNCMGVGVVRVKMQCTSTPGAWRGDVRLATDWENPKPDGKPMSCGYKAFNSWSAYGCTNEVILPSRRQILIILKNKLKLSSSPSYTLKLNI